MTHFFIDKLLYLCKNINFNVKLEKKINGINLNKKNTFHLNCNNKFLKLEQKKITFLVSLLEQFNTAKSRLFYTSMNIQKIP